ncbi:MAG TPA: DivIVA domain-containing protein [Ilumatobacteraceae bacterium]|nr:DivIVA domain-containing protein [Ilumatobacteraceae bacterium]
MSPQRVRSAEFKTVRKGADPDEVKVFLNDVADELERAQNQSTAMEARARAAVARLQEVSASGADAAPAPVDASVDEAETISRTLLLAQRTADTAVAEARGEAARIVGAANDEAANTLDSTRVMSAQLVDEARSEARRVGEAERISIAGEVEALKARRDFLEADVEQLELFLTEQRNRLREAATSIVDITERVPGGLGEARPPLLSASDDEPDAGATGSPDGGVDLADDAEPISDELVIVADIAEGEAVRDETSNADDPWGDAVDEPTQAMPVVDAEGTDRDEDDFRFSFDDDRS